MITPPAPPQRVIGVRRIGAERRPVAVIEGLARDPQALRQAAMQARWQPARPGYPGVAAALPGDYLGEIAPLLARLLHDLFSAPAMRLLDAGFAMVTADPATLRLEQQVPHVDATAPGRFALVQYLVPGGCCGTAFFRHRATGFETISDARASVYYPQLTREVADRRPAGYIADSTALFERTALFDGAWNRAILYESAALHSGAIADPAALSADPATGRLTVTAFLAAAN